MGPCPPPHNRHTSRPAEVLPALDGVDAERGRHLRGVEQDPLQLQRTYRLARVRVLPRHEASHCTGTSSLQRPTISDNKPSVCRAHPVVRDMQLVDTGLRVGRLRSVGQLLELDGKLGRRHQRACGGDRIVKFDGEEQAQAEQQGLDEVQNHNENGAE